MRKCYALCGVTQNFDCISFKTKMSSSLTSESTAIVCLLVVGF